MPISFPRLSRTSCLLIAIGMLAIVVWTQHAMGRIAWCDGCGWKLFTLHAWSGETSQLFADPYSLTHILHGFIFYAVLSLLFPKMPLRYRLLAALGIECGWELVENTNEVIERYRAVTASLNYFGDSIGNSIGDITFCMLGFWIASKVRARTTIALFVLIELVLLFWIRDNLTLNILMLVHPIQAIRDWQTGPIIFPTDVFDSGSVLP